MKNPFASLFRARDKPGRNEKPMDSVSSAATFYFGSSASGKSVTAKVQAWQDRHKPRLSRAEKQEIADEVQPSAALPDDEQTTAHGNANDMAQEPADITPPEPSGIPVTQLQKRLGLLMPASRRYGHPDSNEQSNDQKEEKHHEQNS